MSSYISNTPSINFFAIDGITRSGKFWLSELATYFERVEPVMHEPILDFISIKSYFGELEKASSIDIFRTALTYRCFATLIGRNLNTRFADSSSIYNHPRKSVFLNRTNLLTHAESENLKKPSFDEVVFPLLTHDWLSIWGVQLEAFPTMKLIRIERNPIDLVYAWYETSIGLNEMAFSHRFEKDGKSVPWFARSFYNNFESQSDVDRIIHSIGYLFDTSQSQIKSLLKNSSGNLLVTTYERLGDDMKTEAERISAYLKLLPIPEMSGFLSTQEKKGRSKLVLDKLRESKLESLKPLASAESFELLLDLAERYEVFVKSIF